MYTNLKKIIIALFFIFFFSGCIRYEETIHIFPNGWVRVSIDFRAPNMIFTQLARRSDVPFFRLMMLPRHKAIKSLPSSLDVMEWYLDRSTGTWHFYTNFYVKSAKNVSSDLKSIFSGQKLEVSIEKGKVNFKRFLDLTSMGRMIANMNESKLIKRELLLGSLFKFKVITPTKIIETNGNISGKNKVEWDYKLLDLVSQPQIMKVVFKVPPFFYHPLFWLLYALISGVGYIYLIMAKI
jgi:hypothetical protein